MKLTETGSIRKDLEAIQTRGWWKYGFLIPPLMFLLIGVVNAFIPEYESAQFLLIGMMLLLNHLSVSFLKERFYKKLSSLASMIFAILFILKQYLL